MEVRRPAVGIGCPGRRHSVGVAVETAPVADRRIGEVIRGSGMTEDGTAEPSEAGSGTAEDDGAKPVVLIVGFDGSNASKRALEGAKQISQPRRGSLEVVYVAQIPGMTGLALDGLEVNGSFDEVEHELRDQVRVILDGFHRHLHFQRRDGIRYRELVSVADEIDKEYQQAVTPIIVVGNSSHRHLSLHSVPMSLLRHSRFPVITVP